MFSNTQDVMDTSLPLSTLMRGEDRVSVVEGVSVSDVRVSVPDEEVVYGDITKEVEDGREEEEEEDE